MQQDTMTQNDITHFSSRRVEIPELIDSYVFPEISFQGESPWGKGSENGEGEGWGLGLI